MLTTIKTAIKNKLNSLIGTGAGKLKNVYDFHTGEFNGYPVATFEPSDVESDYETTEENIRKYIFRIVVHQEITKAGLDGSIDILADVVDAIIDAFDQDYTLGGVVDWLAAVPADWHIYDSPTGEVRAAEIRLVCNKSINIS